MNRKIELQYIEQIFLISNPKKYIHIKDFNTFEAEKYTFNMDIY